MKQSRVFRTVALGLAMFATAPAGAQTSGVGPYYATPSWDQTLPSSTRFIVLTNFNSQAVLDRETGLVWQRSPLGRREYIQASVACLRSTIGNRGGWRLPTINELASVLDPSATAGPAFPSGHPFTGFDPSIELMWTVTSTPALSEGNDFRAYGGWQPSTAVGGFLVDLGGGAVSLTSVRQTWCVRGGLLSGPQY
jgi:hypothetical protein